MPLYSVRSLLEQDVFIQKWVSDHQAQIAATSEQHPPSSHCIFMLNCCPPYREWRCTRSQTCKNRWSYGKKIPCGFGSSKIGAQVYHGCARGSFDVVSPLLDICDASVATIPVRGQWHGTFYNMRDTSTICCSVCLWETRDFLPWLFVNVLLSKRP
jgi:hypothetical protein